MSGAAGVPSAPSQHQTTSLDAPNHLQAPSGITSTSPNSVIPVSTAINTSSSSSPSSSSSSYILPQPSPNIIAYPPSLACHANISSPPHTLAYQAFVPHPSFVGHANLGSYSTLGNQPTGNQCHVSAPALPIVSPALMQLTSATQSLVPANLPSALQHIPVSQPVSVNHTTILPAPTLNHAHLQTTTQPVPLNHATLLTPALHSVTIEQQQQYITQIQLQQPEPKPIFTEASSASAKISKNDKSNNQQFGMKSNNETGGAHCFVCSGGVSTAGVQLSASMPHSHAPLLVLLADVLGYSLANQQSLHSKVVCSSCYQLLEVIDEVQLAQTKNKTDVRRRFQNTLANKGLTYQREDKSLCGTCRRCGGGKGRLAAPRKRVTLRGKKKSKHFAHNNIGSVPESVTMLEVEPDIHVEELAKLKCSNGGSSNKSNSQANLEGQESIPAGQCIIAVTSTASVSEPSTSSVVTTSAISWQSSAAVNTMALCNTQPTIAMQTSSPDSCEALVRVYDNDPVIFSGEERLKVGVMRRDSINESSKFQCQYCTQACESGIALKMHVRVKHMPVLVYDTSNCEKGNISSNINQIEDLEEEVSNRYRMGVRLQNISSEHVSFIEKPFVCLFCECAYKLQCSLQSHYREQHSPHKPFQCSSCEDKFRRNIELTRHKIYKCAFRARQSFKKPQHYKK